MRVAIVLFIATSIAHAAPAEPTGAHPRLLLDDATRTAWKKLAQQSSGPVRASIARCTEARTTKKHDPQMYQGSAWAEALQACLVAWVATDSEEHAKTAIRFFNALLDDLEVVGDGKGGDASARRDRGYAIRNLGPFTALAYDWLHAKLSPEQRAKARKRWGAWLAWYKENGYRTRNPGSNYHAGFLTAATFIAVAQGGEAGADGKALWRYVNDELWLKDMNAALAPGGVLEGGDWVEGWQYGPLSVVSYAAAARVAKRAGIGVVGVEAWLEGVLRRHVYGLAPGDRALHPGGDSESEVPFIAVGVNTLNAVAIGDVSAELKRYARGERTRLGLVDEYSFLYGALAVAGETAPIPRAAWPAWYLAPGTTALFARSRWDDRAVWFFAECPNTADIDHHAPGAGNFALTRGNDHVIVDPAPYGSLSTLTANAPTVVSDQLPVDYQPSQAFWGKTSGWRWASMTGAVLAARCDYADQYKFQDRKSDVPEALRDFVLLTSPDGTDATLVVIDRAVASAMHLRFRVPAAFDAAGAVQIGSTQLAITTVDKSGGAPAARVPSTAKDCFGEGVKRGKCDAARFPVHDYRLVIPGPKPRAVHAISATGATKATVTKLGDDKAWSGVRVAGVRDAVIVWSNAPGPFTYTVPRGAAVTHVVLGATAGDVRADGDRCTVTATPSTRFGVVTLGGDCKPAAPPIRPPPKPRPDRR